MSKFVPPKQLGTDLDINYHIATELRQLLTKLTEAEKWFEKNNKKETDMLCKSAIEEIDKAVHLLEGNITLRLKTIHHGTKLTPFPLALIVS